LRKVNDSSTGESQNEPSRAPFRSILDPQTKLSGERDIARVASDVMPDRRPKRTPCIPTTLTRLTG
jgi:hypothetical protein